VIAIAGTVDGDGVVLGASTLVTYQRDLHWVEAAPFWIRLVTGERLEIQLDAERIDERLVPKWEQRGVWATLADSPLAIGHAERAPAPDEQVTLRGACARGGNPVFVIGRVSQVRFSDDGGMRQPPSTPPRVVEALVIGVGEQAQKEAWSAFERLEGGASKARTPAPRAHFLWLALAAVSLVPAVVGWAEAHSTPALIALSLAFVGLAVIAHPGVSFAPAFAKRGWITTFGPRSWQIVLLVPCAVPALIAAGGGSADFAPIACFLTFAQGGALLGTTWLATRRARRAMRALDRPPQREVIDGWTTLEGKVVDGALPDAGGAVMVREYGTTRRAGWGTATTERTASSFTIETPDQRRLILRPSDDAHWSSGPVESRPNGSRREVIAIGDPLLVAGYLRERDGTVEVSGVGSGPSEWAAKLNVRRDEPLFLFGVPAGHAARSLLRRKRRALHRGAIVVALLVVAQLAATVLSIRTAIERARWVERPDNFLVVRPN
jgi:hypothetical protein